MDDNVSSPQNREVAPLNANQPVRSTITAIRIPADGSLPYRTKLELVKSVSDYDSNLPDSNLWHRSIADDMRDIRRQSSKVFSPFAEVTQTQINLDQLYDSIGSVYERLGLHPRELGDPHVSHSRLRGNGMGAPLDIPLAGISKYPRLSFTHASLRLQPNVVKKYWRSEEAWRYRAFKRFCAVPRESAGLDMMVAGEYHLMYTFAVGEGLRPNKWAEHRVSGDVFVLRMAREKNDDGDWHYEDLPEDILQCSLVVQCMETLRKMRPLK